MVRGRWRTAGSALLRVILVWAVSTLTMLALAGILPDFRLQSDDGDSITQDRAHRRLGRRRLRSAERAGLAGARTGPAAGARPGARPAGLLPQRLAAADRPQADPRRARRGRPGDRGGRRRRDVRRRLGDLHRARGRATTRPTGAGSPGSPTAAGADAARTAAAASRARHGLPPARRRRARGAAARGRGRR